MLHGNTVRPCDQEYLSLYISLLYQLTFVYNHWPMLNYLRKNTKLICWFIVACFGIWGVGSVVFSGLAGGQNVAGKVYGKKVPFQEFNRHLKVIQIFSGSSLESKDLSVLEAQAWQQIALAKKARQKGIKTSDREVRDEILKRLQSPQTHDEELYERWVQNVFRESPRGFEDTIREVISVQKLLDEIPLEMTLTNDALKKKYFTDHPDSKPEDFEKVKDGYHSAMIELLKLETKQKYINQIMREANVQSYLHNEEEGKENVVIETPVAGGPSLKTVVPKPISKEESSILS